MIRLWSATNLTFDALVRQILNHAIKPVVCQDCGFVASCKLYFPRQSKTLGERHSCPTCDSTKIVEADPGNLNEAFDAQYPFCVCEHCGHHFLWDESIGTQTEPDPAKVEPGTWGCPSCKRMTV